MKYKVQKNNFILIFCCITSFYAYSQKTIKLITRNSRTQERVIANVINLNSKQQYQTNDEGELIINIDTAKFNYYVVANNYKPIQSWIKVDSELHELIYVNLDPYSDNSEPLIHNNIKKMEIDGYLLNKESGAPIINAEIKFGLASNSVFTNNKGYFKISSNDSVSEPTREIKRYTDLKIMKFGYKEIFYSGILICKSSKRFFYELETGSGIKTAYDFNGAAQDSTGENRMTLQQAMDIHNSSNYKTNAQNTSLCQNAPTSIRVVTGMPLTGGCSTSGYPINIYSLDTYAENGIDNEWIPSWPIESMKAGSIAYRSYGAWHVNNPISGSYDIGSNHCYQVFVMGSSVNGLAGASATSGEFIEQGGNIARSEYSSELNNLGCAYYGFCACADGQKGEGSGQWLCVSDAICAGNSQYGHSRGMCQWGTHDWVTLQNKTYSWMIDHYYNDGGLFRCNSASTNSCSIPTAPSTSMGQLSCPGSSVNNPPTFTWGGSNATLYKLSCAKYPFGSSNYVYNSLQCETGSSLTANVLNFEAGMIYRYVVRGTSDCSNINCEGNNSNVAYFYIKPSISSVVMPDLCNQNPIELKTNTVSINSPGVINYQWYKDNVLINGATTNTYNATSVGFYKVDVILSGSTDGCSTATITSNQLQVYNSIVNCTSSILEEDINKSIILNPTVIETNHSFYIKNPHNYKIASIILYNSQCQILQEELKPTELNNIMVRLKDDIAPQLIFVIIKFENGYNLSKKIIKQ